MINITAVICSVPREEQALATSVSFVFRAAGSTLGVTMASAVFQNVLRSVLWRRIGHLRDAAILISTIRGNFDEIKNVDPLIKQDICETYMTALTAVFAMLFGLSTLAAVSSVFMREHKLHTNIARS